MKQAETTTACVLIEHGADVLQTDAKGEAVIYLAKKLAEADPAKYGNIYRIMRQNLRVNYNNNNNLNTVQLWRFILISNPVSVTENWMKWKISSFELFKHNDLESEFQTAVDHSALFSIPNLISSLEIPASPQIGRERIAGWSCIFQTAENNFLRVVFNLLKEVQKLETQFFELFKE